MSVSKKHHNQGSRSPSSPLHAPPGPAEAAAMQNFVLNVNVPLVSAPAGWRFRLVFPDMSFDRFEQENNGNLGQTTAQLEKELQKATGDFHLRILLVQSGSIRLECLSTDIRPTATYLCASNMKHKLLGSETAVQLAFFVNTPDILTFSKASQLAYFVERNLPALPALQPTLLLPPRPTDRKATASTVELYFDKRCSLGNPTRFSDEVFGDSCDELVPVECLAWQKDAQYLRLLISDTEIQVVAPNIPLVAPLLNEDNQYLDKLTSLLESGGYLLHSQSSPGES